MLRQIRLPALLMFLTAGSRTKISMPRLFVCYRALFICHVLGIILKTLVQKKISESAAG
jgi:hypothetical protein